MQIQADTLMDGVKPARAIFGSAPGIGEMVKFRETDDGPQMAATNFKVTYIYDLPEGSASRSWPWMVRGDSMYQWLRWEEDEVTLQASTPHVRAQGHHSNVRVPGANPDRFAKIHEACEPVVTLEADQWSQLMGAVDHARSDLQDKPALTCLHMNVHEGEVVCTTECTRGVGRLNVDGESELELTFLVPPSLLGVLSASDMDDQMTIGCDPDIPRISVTSGPHTWVANGVQATYPDIDKFMIDKLREATNRRWRCDSGRLEELAKSAKPFVDDSVGKVNLACKDGELHLTCQSPESGEFTGSIRASGEDPFEVGVSVEFLHETAQAIESVCETVEIVFSEGNQTMPVAFQDDDREALWVVMPMR